MKTGDILGTMAVSAAITTLASCQESRPAKLTVRLTGESGKPVAGYKRSGPADTTRPPETGGAYKTRFGPESSPFFALPAN